MTESETVDNNAAAADRAYMVELRDVHKRFGDNAVLRGVDLAVRGGEVVTVIGPSGGGKSTLLRCVNALEPVTSGQVLLEGQDLTRPGTNLNRIRQRIGIVFQQFNLFPHLTAIDNLTLAPRKLLRTPVGRRRSRHGPCWTAWGLSTRQPNAPGSCPGVSNSG